MKSGEAQKWVELYRDRIQNSLDSKQTQFSIQADNSTYPPSIFKIQNGIIAFVMNGTMSRKRTPKIDKF